MRNRFGLPDRRTVSRVVLVIAATVSVCTLAVLASIDPLVNRFARPGILQAFNDAYPGHALQIADIRYGLFADRFDVDSAVVTGANGTSVGSIGPFSLRGLRWLHLLWGGLLEPRDFASAVFAAERIRVSFPSSEYSVGCRRLRMSVPDSLIVADSLGFSPLMGDEEFFRTHDTRRTRFRFDAPWCSVRGIAFLALLEGNGATARSITIRGAVLDIVVNKEKPGAVDTTRSPMPNEILSLTRKILRVDTVRVADARLQYGERFAVGAAPAWITFDGLQVTAEGTMGQGTGGDTVVVRAEGTFMKAGYMRIRTSIPVTTQDPSFRYSGTLSRMELGALNPFLETAEQIRITSGVLEAAAFDVAVASGRARGTVRVVYRDLILAAVDKHTKSEKGLVDGITSFLANTFTIRGTNVPDRTGALKIGKVSHVRQRDEPFFQLAWFALRSGVRDVVGF
jgi:hypothetical protein